MVDAEQDVLDAELEVAERPLAAVVAAAERHGRGGRPQQVALQAAVGVVQPHEDVGDRGLEPRDRDRLAREPARTGERAADDHGARRHLLPVGGREPAAFRDHRGDLDLDLAASRLLPQERVRLGPGLAQLEKARARLVGARRRERRQREDDDREERRRVTAAPPRGRRAFGRCGQLDRDRVLASSPP